MTSSDAVRSCAKADALLAAGDAEGAYAELKPALDAYPQNPIVNALLARTLVRLGAIQNAREFFERTVSLEPHLIDAQLHYAQLLVEMGELQTALKHIEAAYKPVHLFESHYTGQGEPVRVLQLGSAVADGLTETEQFLGQGYFETTTIAVQYWQRGRALPAHDVVFNSIADPDRCAPVLDIAEWLLSQTPAPVLNPPSLVRESGRVSNAQRLGDIPGAIVPRVRVVPRSSLLDGSAGLEAHGFAFPLLLREPGQHNGRQFFRVDTADELRPAAQRLAGEDVLALEFVDSRVEGRFWKYRAMIVGDEIYPAHLAISNNWNVHYFSAQMGAAERGSEAAFLNDMESAIGPRAMDALRAIAVRLGLDYAGIDFGLTPDGDVVVFEANAAMTVFVPDENEDTRYRREAAFRIFEAARAYLRQIATGR